MIQATYRTRFIAKAFCTILFVLVSPVLWLMLHDQQWGLAVVAVCFCLLSIWGTLLSFTTTITINENRIRFEAAHLLPTWEFCWEEIGRINLDSGGTHDAPGLNMYVLLPRDRKLRKAIFFGSWIANYKQLLREILERVPPDTKIDPDIFRIVRHHGEETLQHTARAIVLKQQTRHSQ